MPNKEEDKERGEDMHFKFKVGDKARVKTLEQMEKELGKDFREISSKFTSRMEEFCGEELCITDRYYNKAFGNCYYANETCWQWTEWMLEKIEPVHELKEGDKVRVRKDRGKIWNSYGEMDKYCGTIQTIHKNVFDEVYELEGCTDRDEEDYWWFDKDDLELYVEDEPFNFKVGDRIICTADDNENYYKKGAIGTIVENSCNSKTNYYVEFETPELIAESYDNKWFVDVKNMKLHTKQKVDFKVGDRIICTQEDNVNSIPCYEVGAIGTIIENEYNDSRSMAVEFETLELIESCGDNMWFVKLEDMELYDTPKASLKLKVGDRIICINNDDSGFYDKGAIGTVVSFEGERDGYRVKFETLDLIDDYSDTWCVLEGDMELYKENKEDSAYELIFRRQ